MHAHMHPCVRAPVRMCVPELMRTRMYTHAQVHLPLAIYAAAHLLVETLASWILWCNGFVTVHPTAAGGALSFSVRLPRPRGAFPAKTRGKDETADGARTTPAGTGEGGAGGGTAMLVVHGIGFGILSYWSLTKALLQEGPVVVAHMPAISLSLSRRRRQCASMPQTVAAVQEVYRYGYIDIDVDIYVYIHLSIYT